MQPAPNRHLTTASSDDVFQERGHKSGKRTIHASVLAADELTALADSIATTPPRKGLPLRLTLSPQWKALTDGVARPGDYDRCGTLDTNLKLVLGNASFVDVWDSIGLG